MLNSNSFAYVILELLNSRYATKFMPLEGDYRLNIKNIEFKPDGGTDIIVSFTDTQEKFLVKTQVI